MMHDIYYIKQTLRLLRQEKLFSAVYIIGTGLSVAMVMTLSIIFYIRTGDMYPEINRSRMLVVQSGTERTDDGSENNSSLSYPFIEACFRPLESSGATVSAVLTNPNDEDYVQSEGGLQQLLVTVQYVDPAFWTVFPFRFLEGAPFGTAEWEAGMPVAVIASSLARRLFGEEEATGRYVSLNFRPYRISGVVRDASFLTEDSYALLWIPFTVIPSARTQTWGETGILGALHTYILAPRAGDVNRLRNEALENVRRYCTQFLPADISLLGQPDRYWQSTVRTYGGDVRNAEPDFARMLLLYGLVFLLLLAVPAVGLSGMIDSRIERRLSEMGIRRVFGAARGVLIRQIVSENFVFTLLGGVLGLLLAWSLVYAGRSWIMELGAEFVAIPPEGTEVFLQPSNVSSA
jgi:putative ABC transport system permease protein